MKNNSVLYHLYFDMDMDKDGLLFELSSCPEFFWHMILLNMF